MNMSYLPFVFFIVYAAVTIFVLTLIARFVSAHERVADSIEKVARALQEKAAK
jgi:hypothetical protein